MSFAELLAAKAAAKQRSAVFPPLPTADNAEEASDAEEEAVANVNNRVSWSNLPPERTASMPTPRTTTTTTNSNNNNRRMSFGSAIRAQHASFGDDDTDDDDDDDDDDDSGVDRRAGLAPAMSFRSVINAKKADIVHHMVRGEERSNKPSSICEEEHNANGKPQKPDKADGNDKNDSNDNINNDNDNSDGGSREEIGRSEADRLKMENQKLRRASLFLQAKLEEFHKNYGDDESDGDGDGDGDDDDDDEPSPSRRGSVRLTQMLLDLGELEEMEKKRTGQDVDAGASEADATIRRLRSQLTKTELELANVAEVKNAEIEALQKRLSVAETGEAKKEWSEEREGYREEIRRLEAEVSGLKARHHEQEEDDGGAGEVAGARAHADPSGDKHKKWRWSGGRRK